MTLCLHTVLCGKKHWRQKTLVNSANYKQFIIVFLAISQLSIKMHMTSHYPWQNIWPLAYGSIFPSSVSTSSLWYCIVTIGCISITN